MGELLTTVREREEAARPLARPLDFGVENEPREPLLPSGSAR